MLQPHVTRLDQLEDFTPAVLQGFDPDDPLAYFTMIDANGVTWTVEMGTDGNFVTTSFVALATEAGDRLTTESGDVLILES